MQIQHQFVVRYAKTDIYEASPASATVTFSTLQRSSGGGSSSSSGSSYAVSVPNTKNGDVTVSPKTAKKGDTVTITVTPDKGYELDTIAVKDANGNTVKLTDKGNGKYTFTMPGSKVTVSAEFVRSKWLPPLPMSPPTLTTPRQWGPWETASPTARPMACSAPMTPALAARS